MIHTLSGAAQQTVFVSNNPQIVAEVAENKGFRDEQSARRTSH
jgi:hypothetical protein